MNTAGVTRKGKEVADVLLAETRTRGPNVGLRINVKGADIVTARLGKREVHLKLAHPQCQEILRQPDETPDVDKSQVGVAQVALAVVSRDTDVVVYPEANFATKVTTPKEPNKPATTL